MLFVQNKQTSLIFGYLRDFYKFTKPLNSMLVQHNMGAAVLKVTQYKKLAPNALWFTYQNLKSCKAHEKTKKKTSKC